MEQKIYGKRKAKEGVVLSNKMQKTIVVAIERREPHPRYGKVVKRRKKVYAHVNGEMPPIGARVQIIETRPISKLKSWLLVSYTVKASEVAVEATSEVV